MRPLASGSAWCAIGLACSLAGAVASCSGDPANSEGLVVTGGIGGGGALGTGGTGGGTGGVGGSGGTAGAGGSGGTGGSIDVGDHLQFWNAGHGVPGPVWSVSHDLGGNAWAANGVSLLLLRQGADQWEHFGEADGLSAYPPISVGGGKANEVYVGYRGLFPDDDPFDDPPEIRSSGGVDRIRLSGTSLSRFHYEIFSPPSPAYPDGRYILRTCYRSIPILSGPFEGDVWFACNHGVAMWNERFQTVQEHQHPAINVNDSLYGGDFHGVAPDPDGNVWLGGDVRTALLRYADEGGQFWAQMDPVLDVWQPGEALDPSDTFANDWVMDLLADGDGLWVASFGNGLAHLGPDGSWKYLSTAQGLPDNRVYGLARDPDGSLWIATDAGLARLRGGRFVQLIDARDGLRGSVLSVSVDTTTSPRRVIVGTSSGIGIYDGP